MARPKRIEEVQEAETTESEAVMPEPVEVKAEEPKVEQLAQYRVLADSSFVGRGVVHKLAKGQVISTMTHEIDNVLAQVACEKL